jgi:hypothetical protein
VFAHERTHEGRQVQSGVAYRFVVDQLVRGRGQYLFVTEADIVDKSEPPATAGRVCVSWPW